ncbi:MAG: 2-dehydropantoate 2-reductase, partial [Comamonadaceae bacterium]
MTESSSLPAAHSSTPLLRFAVMGAGAVGCYFGALLARAGHAVTLIGRPAHVQAVQQHGLRLQTAVLDVQVPMAASTEASAVQGADVVLFCVKSSDSEDAARQIRPHLAPGTLVLTLQNGVDNDERVRAVLDASTPVAAAVVHHMTRAA